MELILGSRSYTGLVAEFREKYYKSDLRDRSIKSEYDRYQSEN